MNAKDAPGTVYMLQVDGGGPIKIGFTVGNVSQRIQSYQGGSPYELLWVGAFKGTKRDEADAHRALAAHRLRGEWFRPTPEVISFVVEKSGDDFTPITFLDRYCFRRERLQILGALSETCRDFHDLAKLAGVEYGELANWRLYLAPPEPDDIAKLMSALPLLRTLPEKDRRQRGKRPGPIGPERQRASKPQPSVEDRAA